MVDKDKLTEKKERISVKKEEKILKATEKKDNAKIKIEEKKLERRQKKKKKRIESHINLADVKIEAALDDADVEISFLLDEIDNEIADGEPIELIIFKAENILEEIFLRSQLKIQAAKNELIANLQNDLEDRLELAVLKENIGGLKEKSEVVLTTLQGKIDTEKQELNEKYGEE